MAVARGGVVLVGRDAGLRERLANALRGRGFTVDIAGPNGQAVEQVTEHGPDVVCLDLDPDPAHGLDLCARIPEHAPGTPVVVLATQATTSRVLEVLRAGAFDLLEKPVHPDVVALTLDRAIAHGRLRREIKRLRRRARAATGLGSLVGESPPMQRLFRLMERIADRPSSVLVVGESGTGKELVAREIHARSQRSQRPFVAINCAALPESLLESELFGHVRGAFTDARGDRDGLFVRASGGTLFLDEIGDMPPTLQPKLLRALQDRTIRPVGSDREVPVDVRVVAATNRDLEALVESGRFRADLLYRLDVIRVDVPPLRERGNDILVLAQRFLEVYARRFDQAVRGFDPEAARRLLAYHWPGNVRELQNAVERAVALAEHDLVVVQDLPARVARAATPAPVADLGDADRLPTLAEVERRHVERVLSVVGGNKARAARILGIDRKTLHRKLAEWGAAG